MKVERIISHIINNNHIYQKNPQDILKIESKGFLDEFNTDCERMEGVKDDSKDLGMSIWKVSVANNQYGEDGIWSRFEGECQEIFF